MIISCKVTDTSNVHQGIWLIQSDLFIDNNQNIYNSKSKLYRFLHEIKEATGGPLITPYNVHAYKLGMHNYFIQYFYQDPFDEALVGSLVSFYSNDLLYLIKRLQRLARRWINKRRITVCMGLHPRLGVKSVLGVLPVDLIKKILHCL